MGGFYGSVHVRTDDPRAVRTVLENVIKARKVSCYLAPAINGWVSVFPEGSGQDWESSNAIAKEISCNILHVLVHDDDIFCYRFYRNGKVIDEYNSNPSYFEQVSAKETEKLRGRPELFAEFIAEPKRVKALEELKKLFASSDKVCFACESLEKFAAILKVPNALSSYEYLKEGETEGIKQWKKFVHIPEVLSEKKALAAALKKETQRLKDEGVLLYEKSAPKEKQGLPASPIWCVCGNGFLILWKHFFSKDEPLEFHQTPWKEATQTGISLGAQNLQVDRTGRLLASVKAKGQVQLFEIADSQIIRDLGRVSDSCMWAEFTQDGKQLITDSAGKVSITSLETMQTTSSIEVESMPYARATAHPDNRHLILASNEKLSIIDLSTKQIMKMLYVGGRVDTSALWASAMEQAKAQFTPEAIAALKAKYQKKFGSILQELKKSGISPPSDLPDPFAGIEKEIHDFKLKMASPDMTIRGLEQVACMTFTADGEFLCIGTNQGLRVFAWKELLAAHQDTPKPAYSADVELLSSKWGYGIGQIYDIFHDVNHNLIIYCELAGKIKYLNLSNGRSGTLIQPPGKRAINQIGLSRDGSFLCCSSHVFERNTREPWKIQIWNYPALLKNAL